MTQNSLNGFSGSEVVTLELAEFFQAQGAKVQVFTWEAGEPMLSEFEKRNISVTTDDYSSFYDSVDYVWVHHQVLPIGLVKKFGEKNFVMPFFFFYHMSSLEDLYLEHPYIRGLEQLAPSKTLFVSDEAKKTLEKLYGSFYNSAMVFPNSFPEKYAIHDSSDTKKPELKKVLVVSNHPPEELNKAKSILAERGVELCFLGQGSEKYQIITPELLADCDAVITIGKTVQHCLALNIPVYVYDHFGGCGYLSNRNYEKARWANFSGRGFKKKDAGQICDELISGFEAALRFQTDKRADFLEAFSLKKNMERIFDKASVKQQRDCVIPGNEVNYLIAEQNIARSNILVKKCHDWKVLADERLNLINSLMNSRAMRLARVVKNPLSVLKRQPKHSEKQDSLNRQDYVFEIIREAKRFNGRIIGLIRERNEALILDDTLTELEKIVDGFILLDDNSDDNSVEIAKKHPKCLAIVHHKKTAGGDRSMEESIHRQLLLDEARKYNPAWLFYQDADERVEDTKAFRDFMLDNIDNPDVSSIKLSLFDAYMTKGDEEPYTAGRLFNFRKMFGQERRDILMAWKNMPEATFMTHADMREPDRIDYSKAITKFYVQHYGKAISEEQWEETCDYYVAHFPQYAEKWAERKGKAVHDKLSDFGTALMTWDAVKKSGGILIN